MLNPIISSLTLFVPQNTSSEIGELEEMDLIFTPVRPSTFRELVLTVQEGITMDGYGYGHYLSEKTEDLPTVTNPASPASVLCLSALPSLVSGEGVVSTSCAHRVKEKRESSGE